MQQPQQAGFGTATTLPLSQSELKGRALIGSNQVEITASPVKP
jgi:hypothetical protein